MVLIEVTRCASGRLNTDTLPFTYKNMMSPVKAMTTHVDLAIDNGFGNFYPGDLIKPAWLIQGPRGGNNAAFGMVVSVTRRCIVFVINDIWMDEA
jgi:hypothetical protein